MKRNALEEDLALSQAALTYWHNQVKNDIKLGYHEEARATHQEGHYYK
jgi:hypothetical protein|tara:strand:- start:205 stop:348 length:144 start_codon:yes stop_codon:yes gene_type:complete